MTDGVAAEEVGHHHAAIGAKHGFHRILGDDHSALFVRGGNTLIVTFENLDDVREKGVDRLPWGHNFVLGEGWSMLGLMAHRWTWYRDSAVQDFFDELRDSRFFSDFDRVVFYGASMGGYAAAAYSAASPGATVIALSPQATLARDVTSWETRYRRAWRRDFSTESRYAYAPDMVRSADRLYLFFDPSSPLDAMHAALFRGENLTKLNCRHMGHRIASLWLGMGILKPIVTECVAGSLTGEGFYRYLRRRRDSVRYERELLQLLVRAGKPARVARYCRAILGRRRAPAFRRALIKAEAELALKRRGDS
jgi:pimeloyl-ACP methyl ester carboxylesterase